MFVCVLSRASILTPEATCQAPTSHPQAREIREFTGVRALYEPPANPEIDLPTAQLTVGEGAFQITAFLAVSGKQSALSTFVPGRPPCPQHPQVQAEAAGAATQDLAGARGPEPGARLAAP